MKIVEPVTFLKLMHELPAYLEITIETYEDMGASKRVWLGRMLLQMVKDIKVVDD